MKALSLAVLLATVLSVAGCRGGPEHQAGDAQEQPAGAAAPADADRQPASGGDGALLAPVDAWRRRLDELVPSPWRLEEIEAQVQAPAGWTRTRGSRGLVLVFTDGNVRQRFWVMPAGFEGRPVEGSGDAEPAALHTRNEEYLLFREEQGPASWSATAEVVTALGLP